VDYATLDIPPPPELPAVPAGPACEPFDEWNPACRNDPRMCTLGHADCKCPTPPDANNPACWATMPCPSPPDRRVRACRSQLPPCPDPPDDDNPNCPAGTVIGRVIAVDGRLVTIGVGTAQGVTAAWSATLLARDSPDLLPDGDVRIVRIARVVTIRANPRVRFQRPVAVHR
jgi:hypothetical protein